LVPFRIDENDAGAAERGAEALGKYRNWRTSAAMGDSDDPARSGDPRTLLERCVVAGGPEAVTERLLAYADAGCETFILQAIEHGAVGRRHTQLLGESVLPALRAAGVRNKVTEAAGVADPTQP
jgi:alkanesulfonate monooxygenase SsuD/methylene tetrahydromethanopterin reductase-like flavin-dependent oxidoreductase (luciferase family)